LIFLFNIYRYNKISGILIALKEKIIVDREKGYKGELRGQEVCLPNFQKWLELGDLKQELLAISRSQSHESFTSK
jgi:hypothetical protein